MKSISIATNQKCLYHNRTATDIELFIYSALIKSLGLIEPISLAYQNRSSVLTEIESRIARYDSVGLPSKICLN